MATGALPMPVHPAMAASPPRMYTPYASRPFNSTIALAAWDHGLGTPFSRTNRKPSADFAVSRSTILIMDVSRQNADNTRGESMKRRRTHEPAYETGDW